ncbi:tRNA pseudouridine(38-40) synthase TruA [Paludifilum halophilum]|uniref:tRNA pseudouridine synthase A n=1 Tax=Paludifilum halophilum TaxID=1642702 RepID=A0A235B2H8_9BACL|nr:tRNA pseudouridine(38-40) synthase TruA [Paludifilum halophilum]OYD06506.1 tRNA pseudouridine(38-40) synthase TruA [Paludifilum halophilum]
MRKLKMIVAYDGTDFSGFQRQPDRRTVQGALEEVLSRITREPVQVTGAGRTDAGVHAWGQVIHFDTTSRIPLSRWLRVMNVALPRDMAVRRVEEVPLSFHARKDACWKRYRYTLDNRPVPDVFTRRFRTRWKGPPLKVDRMRQAAHMLIGTHDFTSFSSAKSPVVNRVRTLYRCQVWQPEKGVVAVEVAGNGFLYNMVRIIAGTLSEVGAGMLEPNAVREILDARNRARGGKTLSPEGLTMMEVGYNPWEETEGEHR